MNISSLAHQLIECLGLFYTRSRHVFGNLKR